jgi:hypothetical protein
MVFEALRALSAPPDSDQMASAGSRWTKNSRAARFFSRRRSGAAKSPAPRPQHGCGRGARGPSGVGQERAWGTGGAVGPPPLRAG